MFDQRVVIDESTNLFALAGGGCSSSGGGGGRAEHRVDGNFTANMMASVNDQIIDSRGGHIIYQSNYRELKM